MTVPRKAIMDVFQNTKGHLSAEDVFFRVHREFPHVGLTTVYRTLELLTEMGFLCKHDFGDNRARYERMGESTEDHHHHLVCTRCKKVVNYSAFIEEELEFLKRAERGLAKKYNFEIKDHIIQFYGLCDKCRKEQ